MTDIEREISDLENLIDNIVDLKQPLTIELRNEVCNKGMIKIQDIEIVERARDKIISVLMEKLRELDEDLLLTK